jgi:hypothetical protein
MRGRRWLAVLIAVGSISTGVAIAGSGSSETSQVLGDFHAKVKQHGYPCDANHTRFQSRLKGRLHSSDKRLRGRLEAKAESVVNNDNYWGRTEGTVVVRGHHGVKFRGEFVGVVEPGGGAEGFLTGDTTGRHSVHLLANFNADPGADPDTIDGEFGMDSQTDQPYAPYGQEPQDPAILTNACFDKKHGHGHGGHGGGHQ